MQTINIDTATRADLECEIIEHEILPCNTREELDVIGKMTDDQLREAIGKWIAEGDECHGR